MAGDSFEEERPDSFEPEGETAPLRVARPSAPDDELDSLPSDRKQVFSKAGSALIGTGDGLTQGWGDELQGYGGAKIREALRDFGFTKPAPAVDSGSSGPLTVTKTRIGPHGKRTDVARTTTQRPTLSPDVPVEPTFADDYRAERDTSRRMSELAQKEHPGEYLTGNVGGDLASQVAMGALTGGASLTPGGQAVIGGLAGLGGSEADLTKGGAREWGKAGLSTTGGAALGFAGGKFGQKLGGVFGRGAVTAGENVRTAVADAAQNANKVAQKNLRSGIGALGGESSSAERTLEVLEKVAQGGMGATEEMIASAEAILGGEQGAALMRSVATSHLERAGGQMGRIATAKEALKPLQAAATPEAIEAAAEEALKSPIKRQVLPRLATMGGRWAAPLVGGVAGAAIGDALDSPYIGGAVGTGIGSALAMVGGSPGTAMANMARNPGVRKLGWQMVEGALKLGGGAVDALGKYGPVLAREAQRHGLDAAKVLDYVLTDKDPEYAAKKAELLQAQAGGQ